MHIIPTLPISCDMISRHGVRTDLQKLKALREVLPSKTKMNSIAFLGIIN